MIAALFIDAASYLDDERMGELRDAELTITVTWSARNHVSGSVHPRLTAMALLADLCEGALYISAAREN